jgi:hypothetical protein
MSKSFTVKDVADYKTPEKGIYIIVDDGVYNVTGESPTCIHTPWFASLLLLRAGWADAQYRIALFGKPC